MTTSEPTRHSVPIVGDFDPRATVQAVPLIRRVESVDSGVASVENLECKGDSSRHVKSESKSSGSKEVSPEPATPSVADDIVDRRESQIGTMVGNFLIESEIGSGGMGTVFKASQLKPVRREVALKMIRRGLDDEETLRRFHAERQALAMMDHPNIAKIYEADTTPFGNPYFAMEYCSGVPIDEYCRRHRLGIEDRIRLVIQLTRAVESAHRLGVIHRDLKPDNVLVAHRDGVPELKIIDFGIAKFTDEGWQQGGNATRMGELVGTPAYMSPEQASSEAIDARTDVFAIGAILFELLTGSTPLLPPEGGCETIAGIIAYVQTYEATLPSARIMSLPHDAQRELAESLNLRSGQKAQSIVKGDLDWVCLKAIEKCRTDRFATSDDLGDDLQRYLDNVPVSVAAPTISYRMMKFYRRRRGLVWAMVTIASTILVCGSVLGVSEWNRIASLNQRMVDLQNELTIIVKGAETSRERAGQGGPDSAREFTRAETAIAQANSIKEELQSIAGPKQQSNLDSMGRRIELIEQGLQKDRLANEVVERLNDARERSRPIESQKNDESFGKLAGIARMKSALSELGIEVGVTSPSIAAKILSEAPPGTKTSLIESLDFLLSEPAHGAGIFLHEQDGRVSIAEMAGDGAAAASGRLRVGDRLLSIDRLNLVSEKSGKSLRVAAYQALFAKPGESIRLLVARGDQDPYAVQLVATGEVNHWAQDVLSNIDPDPWRTDLRESILEGDIETVLKLCDDDRVETQPACSVIQLASIRFLLDRSNEAVELLQVCQRQHRKNFWANHYLGTALLTDLQPSRPQEALRYLTASVALRPGSTGARLNLAEGYFHVGEYESQLIELKAAAELEPGLESLKKEIARLEAALASKRSHSKGHDHAFETTNSSLRDPATNLQTGSDVATDSPSEELSTKELSSEELSFGEYPEGSLEALEAKAREFAYAGNRASAMEVLAEASKSYSGEPLLQRMRGAILLDLGDYTAARIVLSGAARVNSSDAATRYYHGVALAGCGNLKDAIHEYRAALHLRPDYNDVKKALRELEKVEAAGF